MVPQAQGPWAPHLPQVEGFHVPLDAHDRAQNFATVWPQALVHHLHRVLCRRKTGSLGSVSLPRPLSSSPRGDFSHFQTKPDKGLSGAPALASRDSARTWPQELGPMAGSSAPCCGSDPTKGPPTHKPRECRAEGRN